MMKKMFLKMSMLSCLFFILLLAACASNNGNKGNHTSSISHAKGAASASVVLTSVQAAPSPTPSQTGYAATVHCCDTMTDNGSGYPLNSTTIYAAPNWVHDSVATFTQTRLPVPPRAQGQVYIQNYSDKPQTIVSDTPNGFAPFTIPPNKAISLSFYRAGTFQAHLKDYPISANTTVTIVITYPYVKGK